MFDELRFERAVAVVDRDVRAGAEQLNLLRQPPREVAQRFEDDLFADCSGFRAC